MTARHIIAACALFVVAADAASGQTTFAYRYTAPATFKYVSSDTIVTNMDTPMGPMSTKMGMAGNYTVSVTPKQDSTHVKLEIGELKGTMEAMGQSMAMPEQPFGPIEFMVGRTGAAARPAIPGGAAAAGMGQMGPGSMMSRMFLRLPAGPVRIGATWTDTLNETMDTAGIKMVTSGTSTNTYAADTTVNGQRLHVIRVVTDAAIKGNIDAGGQQMTQNMKMQATSYVLWDPRKSIFVSIDSDGTMTGTMEMAGMGTMNMTATTKNRMRLDEK
jgi:hypothetical protein